MNNRTSIVTIHILREIIHNGSVVNIPNHYTIKISDTLDSNPDLTREGAHRMLDRGLDVIIEEIKLQNG